MYFQHGRRRVDGTSERQTVVTQASDETFDTWLGRPYISEELRAHLSEANVLLVPNEERSQDTDRVYFPAGTEEFLESLRASGQGISADICISDEKYQELARYADWLVIATVVVQSFVAPLIVTLTANYIERRLGKREMNALVKSELIVQDEEGRATLFSYEGPASEYHSTMTEALRGSSVMHEALSPEELNASEEQAELEE